MKGKAAMNVGALYRLARAFIAAFARIMLRLEISGRERLPPGAAIIVLNHPSATDPFVVHLLSRRPLHVMITEKAFRAPIFGAFLRAIGEIAVPLRGGSAALRSAAAALASGRPVAIFIEGWISPAEGGFNPPRSGAVRLALSSGAPIVPVGIAIDRSRCVTLGAMVGGRHAEARWYFRGPYAIVIGKPFRLDGDPEDRGLVRDMTEDLMDRIASLAGEREDTLNGALDKNH